MQYFVFVFVVLLPLFFFLFLPIQKPKRRIARERKSLSGNCTMVHLLMPIMNWLLNFHKLQFDLRFSNQIGPWLFKIVHWPLIFNLCPNMTHQPYWWYLCLLSLFSISIWIFLFFSSDFWLFPFKYFFI